MSESDSRLYDIFIIGGGINGCGIARDAAGRGYSTKLVEKNDLASGTSSQSSKLVHGGLRYLEHFEFRLVREAIGEREVLLRSAPHIIWPMRFVLPHHESMRSKLLLRLGLFLYDNIGNRKILEKTKYLDLQSELVGESLKPIFSKGFEYSDCWVDDARLVVLNAQDAHVLGADINTHTEFTSAERIGDTWKITTRNTKTNELSHCRAKVIVNAAGPWVDDAIGKISNIENIRNVRLVKGSHIVVPKLYDHDRSYIFQNSDGRVIFALPYEQDYLLIGTSDEDYTGDLNDVSISADEIEYFCSSVNSYFGEQIKQSDIIATFSGIRPLYDDGADEAQEATRDYVIKVEGDNGSSRLINIFGGKITTYRKLSESILEEVGSIIGTKGDSWTSTSILPGGEFEFDKFDELVSDVLSGHDFLDRDFVYRLVRTYGMQVWKLLDGATSSKDMGKEFGCTLTEREVSYLVDHEWATCAEDIIWRRTKLGIRMSSDQVSSLDAWLSK